MLNRLRIRLTLLYLMATIVLVGTLAFSAYSVLDFYFTRSNDMALRYKMALTFASIGLTLPGDLQEGVLEWSGHNELAENETHESQEAASEEEREEASKVLSTSLPYEGELSSIFILPLDEKAGLVINPNPFSLPMDPDKAAVIAAMKNGSDFRTAKLRDGSPVRLLTYSIPRDTGFAVLQMGKPVAEQKRLMDSFLSGIALAGSLIIIFMGIGSWWLAGRSLRTAQKAWDMQRSFIANASHELRAPLTLIRASSEVIIRQAGDGNRQRDLLKNITDECDHMSQLVEDLLLISKLDSHQLKLDINEVPVAGLLEDVKRQFTPLAEKKRVNVVVGETTGMVKGDRLRLRQILIILVDNALRFTPEGGSIELSSRQSSRMVTVTVRDNGRGIPAEHLEHLFERFFQPGSGKNDVNSNGLGLSIAKSLVEAHSGTIQITSNFGDGTRVTLTLPAAK